MVVGRFAVALVWVVLGMLDVRAQPVALEVAVMPGPSVEELSAFGLAHDLVDRLESSVPPGKRIAWVDPASPSEAPRIGLTVGAGVTMTWAVRDVAETFTRTAFDGAEEALALTRRLGWRPPRTEPRLSDPEVAGLLLVFPERALSRSPSARAVELFWRARERYDEPLARGLVEGLVAASAVGLREESPCEGGALAGWVAEPTTATWDTALKSLRGPGSASVLHLAVSWPEPRGALEATKRITTLLKADGLLEAQLEARDRWGATPLLRALATGNEQAALLLLQLGARVTARTYDRVNAIHAALRGGLGRLVPALVRRLPATWLDQHDGAVGHRWRGRRGWGRRR